MPKKPEPAFRNVALLPEDHQRLKEMAANDHRTMTRQLAIIIRREFDKFKEADTV